MVMRPRAVIWASRPLIVSAADSITSCSSSTSPSLLRVTSTQVRLSECSKLPPSGTIPFPPSSSSCSSGRNYTAGHQITLTGFVERLRPFNRSTQGAPSLDSSGLRRTPVEMRLVMEQWIDKTTNPALIRYRRHLRYRKTVGYKT